MEEERTEEKPRTLRDLWRALWGRKKPQQPATTVTPVMGVRG